MIRSPLAPRTRKRRDRGAVIPLVALALSTLMISTAFSVDLGRLRTARRDLQADADFLALDAASVLDGMTADEALPYVVAEAQDSADRNQYAFEPIAPEHIELGLWELNTFTPVTGSQIPNAVRVTLTDAVEMLFDFSTDERQVTRTAIGVDDFLPDCELPCADSPPPDTPETTTTTAPPTTPTTPPPPPTQQYLPASRAELGSVLARLDTYQQPSVDPAFNESVERMATFMNHIYTSYLGVDVPGGVDFGAGATGDPDPVTGPATGLRLDAVSYQGLAASWVSIDELAEELRVNGVLAAGTVDELLVTTITVADLLEAAAQVLDPSATSVDVRSILGEIATSMDQTLTMELGDYVQASTGRAGVLETVVNVDDLLLAMVSIINGRNVVDATIPLNFPPALGVAPTTVARVTMIEPPQTHRGYRTTGEMGPSTAQLKIELNIPLTTVNVDLGFLGLGIVPMPGNIPLVLEAAKAESRYDDMACRTATSTSWTDLRVENGGVAIAFNSSATGIVSTQGQAGVSSTALIHGNILGIDLAAATEVNLVRTWSAGVKRTGDLSVNAAAISNVESRRHFPPYVSQWLQYPSLVQPASVDDTYNDLQLNAPNLSSGLRSALKAALVPVVDQIDAVLADPLLQSMGVTLAGSDARIHKVRCRAVYVV